MVVALATVGATHGDPSEPEGAKRVHHVNLRIQVWLVLLGYGPDAHSAEHARLLVLILA